MKNGIVFFTIVHCLFAQNQTSPSDFWNSYSQEEKIAFINGAYGAISKLKSHHKSEVKKQYILDDGLSLIILKDFIALQMNILLKKSDIISK